MKCPTCHSWSTNGVLEIWVYKVGWVGFAESVLGEMHYFD